MSNLVALGQTVRTRCPKNLGRWAPLLEMGPAPWDGADTLETCPSPRVTVSNLVVLWKTVRAYLRGETKKNLGPSRPTF